MSKNDINLMYLSEIIISYQVVKEKEEEKKLSIRNMLIKSGYCYEERGDLHFPTAERWKEICLQNSATKNSEHGFKNRAKTELRLIDVNLRK